MAQLKASIMVWLMAFMTAKASIAQHIIAPDILNSDFMTQMKEEVRGNPIIAVHSTVSKKDIPKQEKTDELPCTPFSGIPIDESEWMPNIPNSFTSRVEASIMQKDSKNLRVGVEQHDGIYGDGFLEYKIKESPSSGGAQVAAVMHSMYYRLPEDEITSIQSTSSCSQTADPSCDPYKSCRAMTIKRGKILLEKQFGFVNPEKLNTFMGAVGIFQWGPKFGYRYFAESTCRGMVCLKYESCIADDNNSDQVVHIVYYWSGADWPLNTNGLSVPVSVEITSNGPVNDIVGSAIHHIYDFYDFFPEMRPDPVALSPPADVYCHNRKTSGSAPQPPSAFSYVAEIVFGLNYFNVEAQEKINYRIAVTQTEVYDWVKKVAMVEFVPLFLDNKEHMYQEKLRRIDDFNQGLSYYIFPNYGNLCSNVTPILNISGDATIKPDGSVGMKSPSIFENMDEQLQYNGLHWTRGMEAEVWIGSKQRRNGSIIFNDTFVYYYSTSVIDDGNNLDKSFTRLVPNHPIKLEYYKSNVNGIPHIQYHIRDFDSVDPFTHTLDVSSCYKSETVKHFIVDLPEDTMDRIYHRVDELLYAAQSDMALQAGVSPVRISGIQVDESVPRLLFTMLPLSDVQGDTNISALETPLDEAVMALRAAINSDNFYILVNIGYEPGHVEPIIAQIQPVQNSMVEVRRTANDYTTFSNNPYDSGDMAAIGICMFLATFCLTVVAYFGFKKYREPLIKVLPRVSTEATNPQTLEPKTDIELDHDLTI